MYGFLETLLWLSVAIPFAGFGYCVLMESYGEAGLVKSRARWGLVSGLAAAGVHLAQAVGLNLSIANSVHSSALLGFLWVYAPMAGVGFALLSLVLIRANGDHEVRSVGTASAVIAGGSMGALVVLFMMGFGTP